MDREYRETGQDVEKAKKDQLKNAINSFNKFVLGFAVKNNVPNKYEDFREEHVSVQLMKCFAGYYEVERGTPGELALNTARAYFGAVKNGFLNKFPNLASSVLTDRNYSSWYASLTKYYIQKHLADKTPVTVHHSPVTADDQLYLLKFMFSCNMHEECALQTIDWPNLGRITEGLGLDWNDLISLQQISNSIRINCFRVRWVRGKTWMLTAVHHFLDSKLWTWSRQPWSR